LKCEGLLSHSLGQNSKFFLAIHIEGLV